MIIRQGVFETNSSSTHTVVVNGDYNLRDTVYPNEDGILKITKQMFEEGCEFPDDNPGTWYTKDTISKLYYFSHYPECKERIEKYLGFPVEIEEYTEPDFPEAGGSPGHLVTDYVFDINCWLYYADGCTSVDDVHFAQSTILPDGNLKPYEFMKVEIDGTTVDLVWNSVKLHSFSTKDLIESQVDSINGWEVSPDYLTHKIHLHKDGEDRYVDFKVDPNFRI